VGGFSLSRGLTLEGLTISYFLRNSIMYDTLMQMGRWFGYRPEYEDLCRIWMLDDAEDWYRHIAESIEELREELRTMEAANATPREFGLKVRSHPTTLEVTARNKMGSGTVVVVQIGLANEFIETTLLRRDGDSLRKNYNAVGALATRLRNHRHGLDTAARISSGWLVKEADVSDVVSFISEFQNHPGSMLTDPGPVMKYIEKRAESELAKWDVLFASLQNDPESPLTDNTLGVRIICQKRTAGKKSDRRSLRITDNQRVASRGVEKAGLTEKEIEQAEAAYRSALPEAARERPINFPDRIYRSVRKRPLLIVHLLQISGMDKPVFAWSISFPSTQLEEVRVEYVVNTTWMRENYPVELDDDEMESESD
jgi:hypothetical protein